MTEATYTAPPVAGLPLWAHSRRAGVWSDIARMLAIAEPEQRRVVAAALRGCGVPWWTAGVIAGLELHPDHAARWRRRRSLQATQDRIWLASLSRRRGLASALAAAGVLHSIIEAVCAVHDREDAA
jgi:hypothetical protein